MRLPSFIGIGIMALGVALVYIGIHNWYPTLGLKLPNSAASVGASGGGGGGFG